MPSLLAYRREMLRREPSLGRVEALASAGTGYLIVNRMRTGSVQPGKGTGKYLVRAEAALVSSAAVDRERVSSTFNSTTGRFDHVGLPYTDVTATDEEVEILEHEPMLFDLSVQMALKETRFLYRTEVPANMSGRYWLGDLDWLNDPSDISRIGHRTNPVLTRNRHMEAWNGYSTAGALVPDFWTLAGSGATFARETTNVRRGGRALSVTRSGTDATVDQTVEVLDSGVGADSLRGLGVTGVLVGRSGVAAALSVTVASLDYAGNVLSSTDSDDHDGDDDYAELTAAHTVHADAERVRLRATLAVNDTAEVDELYLCYGTLTDSIRRDAWSPVWSQDRPIFEQGQPLLNFGHRGPPTSQVLVESYRPYAAFDQTRVDAGLADSDTHDAPLGLVAEGALHHLYATLEPSWQEAKTEHATRARTHFKAWNAMRAAHLHVEGQRSAGWSFPPREQQYVRARVGR